MIELTSMHVRAYKGAALSILMLMMIERDIHRTMSQDYLRRYTGYSAENIHDAVLTLKENGLLIQISRYEWALADGIRQLPLGAVFDQDVPTSPDPERPAAGTGSANTIDVTSKDASTNSSDIIGANASSSSRSLNLDSRKENLLLDSASSEKIGAKSRSSENLAMLDRYGIREPARSRLAALPHVTPELIAYHCLSAETAGLAIYRIEHDYRMDDAGVLARISTADVAPVEPAPVIVSQPDPDPEAGRIWSAALEILSETLPTSLFNAWVKDATGLAFDGATLTIGVCNEMAKTTIQDQAAGPIRDALASVAGSRIEFNIELYYPDYC